MGCSRYRKYTSKQFGQIDSKLFFKLKILTSTDYTGVYLPSILSLHADFPVYSISGSSIYYIEAISPHNFVNP